MIDRLLVRARAIHARLLAVWPDFVERVREYERMARLLDIPWDDAPLTHADLDKIFHRMDIHAPRCLNMGGHIIVKERS
jgi:hypothetical protein